MQALTAAISDFALTACKIVQKVNLFRNRVNAVTQLRSYAVA